MQHYDGTFQANDGLRLFEQSWRPEGELKAVVVIVHGHGRSEGTRALVCSFDEYLADFKHFLSRINEHSTGKPVFLLGHSLGWPLVSVPRDGIRIVE